MSQYSHSHPCPPRVQPVSEYIVTKKPKPRKLKFREGQRSQSSSPKKKFVQPPPGFSLEPAWSHFPPQTPSQAMPQISAFTSTPSQVREPVIVQASAQDPKSRPSLYLIHPDSETPIELPPWVAEFRPRIPPLIDASRWESPIPRCESITHAILIREALTKFHFAVYLADEDAGESDNRFRQNLAQICAQYMPAMETLGIKKHQIVFFYHGRKQIRMGNMLWDAIEYWKEKQWRVRLDTQETEHRFQARGYGGSLGECWSYPPRKTNFDQNGREVYW